MRQSLVLASQQVSERGTIFNEVGRTFEDVLRIMDKLACRKEKPSTDSVLTTKQCNTNVELTRMLARHLGMNECLEKLRFVHVTGTKGKGTTATYIAALLKTYGLKVGLFTSPHISDIRERILVNSELLPREVFAEYFFQVRDRFVKLAESEKQLFQELSCRTSFFRYIFLTSLLVFIGENVDVAVMEVGIGGRHDTTNIIVPEVSVITALGIDHTKILGNTVEEIALDKAGIMKPGVICYSATQRDHPTTRQILRNYGNIVGAPLIFLEDARLPEGNWPKLAIGGSHAIENSKLALLAARQFAGVESSQPLSASERYELEYLTLAGRSQVTQVGDGKQITFYLDGAHTYESLSTATRWFLSESSSRTGEADPRRVLLLYSSRDPRSILKAFTPFIACFSKAIIACVSAPKTKRDLESIDSVITEVNAIAECWELLHPSVECVTITKPFQSLEEVVDIASMKRNERGSRQKPAQTFVTGSFFLVADIARLLNKHLCKGTQESVGPR
ncbi:putative folylpolyglutamate-dihydrofolate synthetase [Trypanosoma vivax]|nr:putative folylpolyglutamate-dihydrofolate synthetase [Trypanosoma vivax]